MPEPKKPAPARKQPGSSVALRRALTKRKKSELVDVLIELARADCGVLRQPTTRFDVATPPSELVAATRQAIADATAFDERDINRNFELRHRVLIALMAHRSRRHAEIAADTGTSQRSVQ